MACQSATRGGMAVRQSQTKQLHAPSAVLRLSSAMEAGEKTRFLICWIARTWMHGLHFPESRHRALQPESRIKSEAERGKLQHEQQDGRAGAGLCSLPNRPTPNFNLDLNLPTALVRWRRRTIEEPVACRRTCDACLGGERRLAVDQR